jgi:hypothetical protein
VVSLDDSVDREDQNLPAEEPPAPEPRAPDAQPHPDQLTLEPENDRALWPPRRSIPGEPGGRVVGPGTADLADLPPDERRPSKAATIVALAVLVMALIGVFAVAAAAKLYLDQRAAVSTLDRCVSSLSEMAATPGTPEALQRRVAWLVREVKERDYKNAQAAIDALTDSQLATKGLPPFAEQSGAETPPGRVPSPLEADGLPDGARRFFADNPELWKAFLGFTRAALRLREAGLNVDDLLGLRDSMVEAARLGQKDRVEKLLAEARDLVKNMTGEDIPDDIKQKLDRFARAFQEARRQRKDVRLATGLAERAQRAAQRGDLAHARELIDKATTALEQARPMRRSQRPPVPRREPDRPERQEQPPLGFLRYLANSIMRVMQAEERDLAHVWQSVNTAAGAVREKNADQVREILTGAVNALEHIGVRRRNLTRDLEAREQQAATGRDQGGQPPPGLSREQMVSEVRGRIADVLAEVRKLSDEDFEKYKTKFAEELVDAVIAGGRQRPGPEPVLPEGQPTPEQRARAKMQMAGDTYLRLKALGADTGELDVSFSEARKALQEGDYETAERIVDSNMALMRELLQQHGAAPELLPPLEGEPQRLEYSTPIIQESEEPNRPAQPSSHRTEGH